MPDQRGDSRDQQERENDQESGFHPFRLADSAKNYRSISRLLPRRQLSYAPARLRARPTRMPRSGGMGESNGTGKRRNGAAASDRPGRGGPPRLPKG